MLLLTSVKTEEPAMAYIEAKYVTTPVPIKTQTVVRLAGNLPRRKINKRAITAEEIKGPRTLFFKENLTIRQVT